MFKHLKIIGRAFVNGAAVTPESGVVTCAADEADRLIDAGLAEDVSDDFADADADPVETAEVSAPPETSPPAKPATGKK
jgi:hypothetical protein